MLLRRERIEGGLVGLLVGDALGVPYEFKPASELPEQAAIEFDPPPGYPRTYAGLPVGTWSDDGAQALCLLESLLHTRTFDPADFARRLVRWMDEGHLAVDGFVFDVGIQTRIAVGALRAGGPALLPDSSDARTNGNGALMRVLPLALAHEGSDAELVRDARLSSRVTHPHLRSALCCALYCLYARRILAGTPEPWRDAVASMRSVVAGEPEALRELTHELRVDEAPVGHGSGYVVDSLNGARMLLERGDYERVVKSAVALGGDTDTTAAIAGGLAGVRDGIEGIPTRFRRGLRGRSLLDPLLAGLLERTAERG